MTAKVAGNWNSTVDKTCSGWPPPALRAGTSPGLAPAVQIGRRVESQEQLV
jgi:hypothetical protein